MSINVDVHGNTNPLVRDVDAAVKRINRSGGIKIQVDDKGVTQPLGNMRRSADEFTKSLEASNARVLAFGASVGIINAVSNAFKGLVEQTIKVEKNLTDINVVMGLTSKQLDKFGSGLFKVATETGAGFQAASEAATEFARQGLSVAETLRRTKDALVLTRLTGMKSTEAVKSLTAAMNTFKGEIKDSTQLVSKFAAVDVKFAVSAQDFADAIARAGASARDAGVDINQLIGLVTAAQERTARGGAVIGNSFKTIFTRVRRSSTLQELENLGVAVRDLEGKTLPAMRILQDLANRYDSLTDSQRSYISQNVAGVFQINILKAAMADLGKANSVTAQATAIAAAATDESSKKNEQLRQTMAALAGETGVAIQNLAKNIGDIALAPGISKVLDGIKGLADGANNLLGDGDKEGSRFAKGLLAGIGNFISGPGLVIITAVISKLFVNAMKYGMQSLSSLLNINKAANQRRSIEQNLMMVLSQNAALQKEMLRTDISRADKEKIILSIIKQQTVEAAKLSAITKTMTPALIRQGVGPNLSMRRGATGFVPNYAIEDDERRDAIRGGYAPGGIKQANIPGVGPVTYNAAEDVKKFPGMSQPAIVPPQGSRAARAYDQEFMGAHGFSPYASGGYVPNYALSNAKFAARIRSGKMTLSEAKAQGYTTRNEQRTIAQYNKQNAPIPSVQKNINKKALDARSKYTMFVPSAKRDTSAQVRLQASTQGYSAPGSKVYGHNTPPVLFNILGIDPGAFKKKDVGRYSGKRLQKLLSRKGYDSIGRDFANSLRLPSKRFDKLKPGEIKKAITGGGESGAAGALASLAGAVFEAGLAKRFKIASSKGGVTSKGTAVGGDFDAGGGNADAQLLKDIFGGQATGIGDFKISDSPGNRESFAKKILQRHMFNQGKVTQPGKKLEYSANKGVALFGNNRKAAAFGYVPNYADPLSDAIAREKGAGVPVSQIRVGSHGALVGQSNPAGLGVTNTRDEPRGLKDVFGAGGFVPNFVLGGISKFMGSAAGVEEANQAAASAAKEYQKLESKLEGAQAAQGAANNDVKKYEKSLAKQRQKLEKGMQDDKQIMNDRKKSSKQRQQAAQRYLRSERELSDNSGRLARTRQKLTASETKLNHINNNLAQVSTRRAAAERRAVSTGATARRRSGMSENRGMAGMGAMMGASMLAGQLQQSSSSNMQAAGGALQGASTGAAMGMMFGPWGAAIGGAVGALHGFVSATEQAAKAARDVAHAEAAKKDQLFLQNSQAQLNHLGQSSEIQKLSGMNMKELGMADGADKVKTRRFSFSNFARRVIKEDEGGLKDYAERMDSAYGVANILRKQQTEAQYMDGGGAGQFFNAVSDKRKREYNQLSRVPIMNSFIKDVGSKMEDSESELAKAMTKVNLTLDNVSESDLYVAGDKVASKATTVKFNSMKEGDQKHLFSKIRDGELGEAPELSLTGLAAQVMRGGIVTERGIMTEQQLETSSLNDTQKRAARDATKVIEKELKQIAQGLSKDGLFQDSDFELISERIQGLSKILGKKQEEVAKMDLGETFKALSIKRSELVQDEGDDAAKQIIELDKQSVAMAHKTIDQLDDNFQSEMIHNGKVKMVNKASLQALRKQAQKLGEQDDFYVQFEAMMASRNLEIEKQVAMMSKQLSRQEVMLRLQDASAEAQQEIVDAQLRVARSYGLAAAELGNKGFSDQFSIDSKYNQGMSKAKFKQSQADLAADDKYREAVISMGMDMGGEDWATLGQKLDVGFETSDPKFEEEVFKKLRGQSNEELKDLAMAMGETDTNRLKKLRVALLTKANQEDNNLRNFNKETFTLETEKQVATTNAKRLAQMQKMLAIQNEINRALEVEVASRSRSRESDDIKMGLSRGFGVVSNAEEFNRKTFDSNLKFDRMQQDLKTKRDQDRRTGVNKFLSDQEIKLNTKEMLEAYENPSNMGYTMAGKKRAQLEAQAAEALSRREELRKTKGADDEYDAADRQYEMFTGEAENMRALELSRTSAGAPFRGDLDKNVIALSEFELKQKNITSEYEKQNTHLQEMKANTAELIALEENHFRGDNAFANGFNDAAGEALRRTENFKYELAQSIPETFSRNMSSAMMKLVREGGDFGDVMRQTATNMLDSINERFMNNFMDEAFGALYKGPSADQTNAAQIQGKADFGPLELAGLEAGQKISSAGDAVSGSIYAVKTKIDMAANSINVNPVITTDEYQGGLIRRSSGGRVPAMLTDGEYVINRSSARRLGGANLSMLNSGTIPASMRRQIMRRYGGGGYTTEDNGMVYNPQTGNYNLEASFANETGSGWKKGAQAGLNAAGVTAGNMLFQKLMGDKDEEPEWEQRPDDFFQKNQLWKSRNMSKRFMLNNSRVKNEIEKGRAAKQKETQDWIDMQNERQALGRQVVTMVGNIAVSAAAGGLSGPDGSFAGLKNEGYGGSVPLADQWFGGGGGEGSYRGGAIRRNSGGAVSGSPGIDRVPAMLSEGEYVINARAARSIGIGNLEKINAGKFNQGGLVGETTGSDSSSPTGANTNNINITVNVTGSKTSETENKSGNSSEADDKRNGADQLSKKIKQEVITIIKEENRPGGLLR